MASLEVYGAHHCRYTADLLEELAWRGEDYRYFDVERDEGALARMLELTGNLRTIPVLVESGSVKEIGYQGRTCTI